MSKRLAVLEAKLNEAKKFKAAVGGDLEALLESYGENDPTPEQTQKQTDLESRLAEAEASVAKIGRDLDYQKQLNERLKEAAPEADSEKEPARPKGKIYTRAAELFMDIVKAGNGPTPARLMQYQAAITGSSEQVPSDGGFLVGKDLMGGIWDRAVAGSEILSRVTPKEIGPNSNGMRINALDESSRADSSRHGGALAYWAGEAQQYTGTKPKLRQVNIELKKVTGLHYATDELLQDAVAMQSFVADIFSRELRFAVEEALVNGDGSTKPLGFLNAANPALVSVAKETGQAASTIVANNVIKMWSRMRAANRRNAVWLINQDIEPQLPLMNVSVGTGGVPVYLPMNGLSDSPYATLYGRPVVITEYNATLGTVNDIALVDPAEYWFIQKGGVETASSIHLRFDYGEQVFRFTYRCGGQPSWNSALTPFKGTATLSPYVVLATRA